MFHSGDRFYQMMSKTRAQARLWKKAASVTGFPSGTSPLIHIFGRSVWRLVYSGLRLLVLLLMLKGQR